jgi:hypothetical protein
VQLHRVPRLASCSRLVALAIGAVTPSRCISQAERHLGRLRASGGGRSRRGGEDAPPAVVEVARHAAAARALRQVVGTSGTSGEEARRQREVGDDAEPLATARSRSAPS